MEKKKIKKSLSIALAVYNEERNLNRVLTSVVFADEIVVVDGGSTDRSIEISRTYSAKIINADNPPIFHINKQKAVDACTGDWILQLDADEEVSPELRDEILSIIDSSSSNHAGYYISRKNQLLGTWMKFGGMFPDYVVRLFKKGVGSFPCKSVHEQIAIKGDVGYLTSSLIHRPYPTFAEYLQKADTYTTLTAAEYRQHNVNISFGSFCRYMIWRPLSTFCTLFIRCRGFRDGFPGFVWALFSGLQHAIAYIKYWEGKCIEKYEA